MGNWKRSKALIFGAVLVAFAATAGLSHPGLGQDLAQPKMPLVAKQPDPGLAPHRAMYSMRLKRAESVGTISGARGAMIFEFKDSCDAWTVSSKVYLRLQYGRGPEVENVRTMATWESKDGLGYRFRVKESQGGVESKEIKGVAALDGAGKEGVAEFTRPRARTVKLPSGTVFPTAHIIELIRGAGAGDKHVGRVVFDGTTVDNPYEVSALISGQNDGTQLSKKVKSSLTAARNWRARLAYFPYFKQGQLPEFELGVDYRADGIISRILQDFGEYAIEARLDQVELLPQDHC